MKPFGADVVLEESPFDFDVWRCRNCGYVLTIQQYTQAALDYRCLGCEQTSLSEYQLWQAKAPETDR